jgi:hypothetical protein
MKKRVLVMSLSLLCSMAYADVQPAETTVVVTAVAAPPSSNKASHCENHMVHVVQQLAIGAVVGTLVGGSQGLFDKYVIQDTEFISLFRFLISTIPFALLEEKILNEIKKSYSADSCHAQTEGKAIREGIAWIANVASWVAVIRSQQR